MGKHWQVLHVNIRRVSQDGFISLDLNIKNLLAQCYDGVSNMRGPYKEVATRKLEESPTAMYIHCNAHILK